MERYSQLLDAAHVPDVVHFWTDFTRQDDQVDLGAMDFTKVSSGTNDGTLAIAAGTNNANGWAVITGAATAATGGQLQSNAVFLPTQGKNIGFKARVQLTESTSTNVASLSQMYIGLTNLSTNLAAVAPTDGFYFTNGTNSTTVQCVSIQGGTSTTTTLNAASTPSAGAFTMDKNAHQFSIAVFPMGAPSNSANMVTFHIDGVQVAQHVNQILPAVTLAPTVQFAGTDATGTKNMAVDYVGTAMVR